MHKTLLQQWEKVTISDQGH